MTVVFKLGGSLLTVPELASKLNDTVRQRTGKKCLFISGGGATTDVVREWSRIHALTDEQSHWLAISSLDLNTKLLQELTSWKSVSSCNSADEHWAIETRPLLLNQLEYIKNEECQAHALRDELRPDAFKTPDEKFELLPHSWDVTSDSLAAWTAIRWPAEELVLLKSVPVPMGLTAKEASEQHLVDSYFPRLANRIQRINWCNLRASSVTIEPWLSHQDR